MKTLDVEWLERAVEAIKGGLADKLEREETQPSTSAERLFALI